MPQEISQRLWSTAAADTFYYKGRDYFLIFDYFSKYPEVTRTNHKNSEAVILAMKEMFVRYGIPEEIIADNMPFNSLRFRDFARVGNLGCDKQPALSAFKWARGKKGSDN